jgi:hypothetical protein
VSKPARVLPPYAIVLLAVAGLAMLVVGGVYFAEPARSLPSFFPGHLAGSSHHHTTHGIAALLVGLVAVAGAWMGAGTKRSS